MTKFERLPTGAEIRSLLAAHIDTSTLAGICKSLIFVDTYSASIEAEVKVSRESLAGAMRDFAVMVYDVHQNDKDTYEAAGVRWNEVASRLFESQCDEGEGMVAAGASKAGLKNWNQYRNNLVRCMKLARNGEFSERDEAGNFVLSGMNKITAFNKEEQERQDEAEAAEDAKRLAAKGVTPKLVKAEDKATNEEGSATGDLLLGGLPEEIQDALMLYIAGVDESLKYRKTSDVLQQINAHVGKVNSAGLSARQHAARQAAAAAQAAIDEMEQEAASKVA